MSSKSIRNIAIITVLFFIIIGNFSAAPSEGSELIGQYPSPDGKYIVDVYRHSGNLTVDFISYAIVRSEHFPLFSRQLYWAYHVDGCAVEWRDNNTVYINGNKLNIFYGSYRSKDPNADYA